MSVVRITASLLPTASANAPTAVAVVAISAELAASDQLSFVASAVDPPNNVSSGSASVPSTPKPASPGPTARISRRNVPVPPMTNPGIKTPSPVPT